MIGSVGHQLSVCRREIDMAHNRNSVRRLAGWIVEAIYVPMCATCGRRGVWVCSECMAAISPILVPGCARCGVADGFDCECPFLPPEIERLRSIYPFRDWVRDAIHRLKYDGERARAPMLAEQIVLLADELKDVDGLVPVPIHKTRMRARGFNQTELLARHISRMSGIPAMRVLERVIDRGSQVGRSGQDRWLAVDGAFVCVDPAAVRNRRLAIIDDVITTGATVSSCAVALADAGAVSVRAISIARG
jgi:ComF family protein